MSHQNTKKQLDKFTFTAIKDLEYAETVKKWSYAELADYMIQFSWANEKWGTLKINVLDRVISELFKLDEESKKFSNPTTLNGLKRVIKSIKKDRKNVSN